MEEKWTKIIKSQNGWFDIDLEELFRYKDLILLFVRRNYVTRYKQTVLGPLWLVISPLFTVLIYSVVFGEMAGLAPESIPTILFYLSGNIVWSYFSTCVVQTSTTFTGNAAILGKVYFPRLVMPISTVLTALIDFIIQYVLFIIILVSYWVRGMEVNISVYALLTPFLLIEIGLLGLGLGIIVSALTTKYRDLVILVNFGMQLWMYATPIVYDIDVIPEVYRNIFIYLNPVTAIVLAFREFYFGKNYVSGIAIGISWIITLGVLFVGVVFFSKVEKTFMDTV